jgi:hypothetical protein
LIVTGASKRLWQTGLFENAVSGVPRFDVVIDRDRPLGFRAKPDFVIALALPVETAPRVSEDTL